MPRSYAASETDHVYPLHFLDQTEGNRIHVHWLLHYDAVLDAQKLHNGLEKLLSVGDWRKLGGRIRSKGNGKLEIHVPREYTTARPAFLYTHDDQHSSIAEHPLAPSLGQQTKTASIQPYSPKLKSLMVVSSTPKSFKGYIDHDMPMLSVRVTSFTDATLIGLTWAHPLMDGLGAKAMLQGWSLVVADRDNELPPVCGAHEDVLLESLHNCNKVGEPEDLALDSRRLTGLSLARFLCRLAFKFVSKSKHESRRVVIPRATLDRLKARALVEAQHAAGGEVPFLSDYNVLTAWFSSIMGRQGRPSTSAGPMNARFRLPEVQKEGVYLQNMVLPLYTFLPAEISKGSVGQIALLQQRQLSEQASLSQVQAFLSEKHYVYTNDKVELLSLLFGEGSATFVGFNDLAKMGVLQVADFGAAVVGHDTQEKRQYGKQLPVRFSNQLHMDILVSFALILSKDAEGSYSIFVSLNSKEMRQLEKELQELATDVDI